MRYMSGMRNTDVQPILLRVPRWAHTAIKVEAARRGCHMSKLIGSALEALAVSVGGSPDDGVYPSPAQQVDADRAGVACEPQEPTVL